MKAHIKGKGMLALMFLFIILSVITINAQETKEESKIKFKVGADVVSTYIWRGVAVYGTDPSSSLVTFSPNFQPSLAMTAGGLEIGAWGSTDFAGGYKEVDIYAMYTVSMFKFGITDYNWTNQAPYYSRFFNYNNDASKGTLTGHILEGTLAFNGTESLPLTVSVNTMFFGADKKAVADTSSANGFSADPKKQAYSTYIELGYTFKKFNVFMGMATGDGFYGDQYKYWGGKVDGFSVVNMGISATKNIEITDKFSLPIKSTFIINPQAELAHLVFTMTF